MWATILAGLKAVAAIFGFGQQVAAEVHDATERSEGAIAQDDAEKTAALKEADDAKASDDKIANMSRDQLVARELQRQSGTPPA